MRLALVPVAILVTSMGVRVCAGTAPEWAGQGEYRVIVQVPALDIGARRTDQFPVQLQVDFAEVLRKVGRHGHCNPGSIQVIRYDPRSGRPLRAPSFAYGRGPYDLPCRLDEVDPRPHWWCYSFFSGAQQGTLAWVGLQKGREASHYAIYFDTLKLGEEPRPCPRGWIGDGDGLFQREGLLPSLLHTRPYPFDWDGDGKLDLLVGFIRGYVFLYRNIGTPEAPRFQGPRLLEADGQPLKVEWYSAPMVADWGGDGLPDIICGEDPNGSVRYYQNVGTRTAPRLTDRGKITADGQIIVCPFDIPEAPGIFQRDYTAVPEVCDWNCDGHLDLLVGGYLSGQILYFENVGEETDGTPRLTARGPLQADGKVIDVSWQASPTTADLDGDGKLELVTGTMYVSPSGGELTPPDWPGLFMCRNRGTATEPVLMRVEFPLEGQWEDRALTNPRFADWNGDGLLDLVVGANSAVTVYRNVGTQSAPRFRRESPLRTDWVPAQAHPDWIGDLNADDRPDFLCATGGSDVVMGQVVLGINPPSFGPTRILRTAAGHSMVQPPAHGDPWSNVVAYDWEGDGDQDLVVGDVAGFVWLHRNVGLRRKPSYAEGVRLTLSDGSPLVAGVDPATPVTDFTVLQGNRAVAAPGDFNGDGHPDLAVGDATGGVTYFQNVGTSREPIFAQGRILAKLSGRVHLAAADLSADGLPDLVVANSGAGAGEQVQVVETALTAEVPQWTFPGRYLPLSSWIPYPQPSVLDVNRDGDMDVVLSSSYGVVYWMEGSTQQPMGQPIVIGCERVGQKQF